MAKETPVSAGIQAIEKLPADVIVHPRIVVTRKSFQEVVEQMESAKPRSDQTGD
jgi:hypothetical protein